MKMKVLRKKWKVFILIAGVFLSWLYSSIRVYAQLNTDGAEKINAGWKDEHHQFSSFDDEDALKVDASYGFKLKMTSETKTIVTVGKTTTDLPDISIPDELRKFTWFKTSENKPGSIAVKKTNMEIYQCEADGSKGHWEKIDLLMTVSAIEKYENQDGYVAIGNGISGCSYIGIEEMTMKSQFFKAGTQTPVTIKSNVTLKDIDTKQYIGVKADSIHGQYVSGNTKLSYKKTNGMNIYYADFETDYDSEDFTCAGFTFISSCFEYTFGRNLNRQPTRQEQYVGSGQNMVKFDSPDPRKYISDEDGNRTEKYQGRSLGDSWTYEIDQAVAGEIPQAHYFKKFMFKDQIEKCLKILNVKIMGDGKDVTDDFSIETKDNQVTALLKNPKDPSFYEKSLYTMKIKVKMDIPENVGKQQLDNLREIWKQHGHYDSTSTVLTETNKAETIVDERTAPTNQVITEIELPEEEKDVPGLKIIKETPKYEYQAKDKVNYKVTVKNTNENADTAYFTIQDISLPGNMKIQKDSVKVTGIEEGQYILEEVKNGWILKSKGDYAQPWNKDIVISYTAVAEVSTNGTLVDNTASAWAAGIPQTYDDCQVYINSPKTEVVKSAPEKVYKQGDHISYKIELTNKNPGTFMQNIEFSDQIRTDGVRLVPGSLAIMSGERDITKDCNISYSKDGRSYRVSTPVELKNGSIPAIESETGRSTGDYDDLWLSDNIQVTYQTLIEKDGLEGASILNTFVAPATKNTNGDLIKEDQEIPSGGGKAEETVKVKAPQLQIVKESDKKEYGVGEKGLYTLKITQKKENLIACNVKVTDTFAQTGMETSEIKVLLNDKDITDDCRINHMSQSFCIETGKNLGEDDILKITYKVYFKEKIVGEIKNTAVAESDNTLKVQDENIVTLQSPVLDIEKDSDNTVYKEGQMGIYQLKVTQKNKGMIAHQVVIEDSFEKEGMEISGIKVKYNGTDITKDCEIILSEGQNQFQIYTGKDLSDKDRILITYRVLFKKMIFGNILNTAKTYGKDADMCQDKNIVTMDVVVPELSIFKSSSKSVLKKGDISEYQVTVLQTIKDAIAKNVVISDKLYQEGVVICTDTIRVTDPEGRDITKNCKINADENSYIIQTGQNLSYDQKMVVSYKVKILKVKSKKLINIASAKGDNTKKVSAKNTVKLQKESYVNGTSGQNTEVPKTGEKSWIPWLVLLIVAGASLVFSCGKRYNRKK